MPFPKAVGSAIKVSLCFYSARVRVKHIPLTVWLPIAVPALFGGCTIRVPPYPKAVGLASVVAALVIRSGFTRQVQAKGAVGFVLRIVLISSGIPLGVE
jgi:hypothetical protein